MVLMVSGGRPVLNGGRVAKPLSPVNVITPSISGSATVGSVLTANVGTWNYATSYAYQWRRNGSNISAATASTYTLQSADEGTSVTVQISGTGTGGSATATSGGVAVTWPAPVANGTVPSQAWTQGAAITTLDLTTYYTGSGITYALAPTSASLPAGLSLSSAGSITGTPTATVTAAAIVVRGTNSGGFFDQTFSVTVTASGASTVAFGALTASGAGGVPVTGSSITSGNASGHWQITSGYLVPTTTGDTANLNAGPYTIGFNDGSSLTVNIEANTRHVRTNAEFASVAALSDATLSGTVCKLRAGTYQMGSMSNLAASNRYYGNATSSTWTDGTVMFEIAAADPTNKPLIEYFPGSSGAFIRAPTNIRWRNLKLKMILRPGTDLTDTSSKGIWVASGSVRNFQAIGCDFISNRTEIGITPSVFGMLGLSNSGNGTQAGGLTLQDCTFDGGTQSISMNTGTASAHTALIERCTFTGYAADCISMGTTQAANGVLDNTKTVLRDVLFTDPWNRDGDVKYNSGATLTKTAALTGAANTQKATFFAFAHVWSGDTFTGPVFQQGSDFRVRLVTAGTGLVNVVVDAVDTTGATVVNMTSSSTYSTRRGEWIGILVSLDTTGTHRLYVWTNKYGSVGWSSQGSQAGGGQTLRLSTGSAQIGQGSMALRWLSYWQGVALDPTSTTVQNYFVDATHPTYLPIYTTPGNAYAITIPAGLVTAAGTPLVEFGRDYGGWTAGTNTGSGGNFTRTGTIERDHGDCFQYTGGVIANARLSDVSLERCILFERAANIPHAPDRQFIFLDDSNGGDMDRIKVYGCAAYVATNYAQFINSPQNSVTRGLTVVPNLEYWERIGSIPASTTPGMRVIKGTAATGSWTIDSCFVPLVDTVDPGYATSPITRVNSISPYATPPSLATWQAYLAANFVGGATNFKPTTWQEFVSEYQVKAGGALDLATDVGALNSYFTFDFVNGGTSAHPNGAP